MRPSRVRLTVDVNFAKGLEAWAVAEGLTVDTTGHVEARILRALRALAAVAGQGGFVAFNNEVLTLLATIAASAGSGGDADSVGGYTPTVTGGALIEAANAAAVRTAAGAGTTGGAVLVAETEVLAQAAIGLGARPVALSTATSAQTATNAQDLGDGFVICDDGTNNNSIRAYYWAGTSITVKCVMNWDTNTNNHQCGLVLRDNAGKYVTFFIYMNGSGTLSMTTAKWDDHDTFNANYSSTAIAASINARLAAAITAGLPFYLRIIPSGASWVAGWSMNGVTWNQFDTRTNTDFLAAVNFVGVAVNPGAISQALSLEVQELTKS